MADLLTVGTNVVPMRKIPTDLMTLSKLAEKYNFSYDYLYKITKRTNELPYYDAGGIRVSEKVFTDWLDSKFIERQEA